MLRRNDEKIKEGLRKSYKDQPEYIQNIQEFQEKVKEEDKEKSGRPSET